QRIWNAPGRHRDEGRSKPRRRGQYNAFVRPASSGPNLDRAKPDVGRSRQSFARTEIAQRAVVNRGDRPTTKCNRAGHRTSRGASTWIDAFPPEARWRNRKLSRDCGFTKPLATTSWDACHHSSRRETRSNRHRVLRE